MLYVVCCVLCSEEVRSQTAEQLRALQERVESEVACSTELCEFYRRRADTEATYARDLEKLVRWTVARVHSEKARFASVHSSFPSSLCPLHLTFGHLSINHN